MAWSLFSFSILLIYLFIEKVGVAQLKINLVFSFNSNMLMATNIFSTDLLNKLTKERREGGGGGNVGGGEGKSIIRCETKSKMIHLCKCISCQGQHTKSKIGLWIL